jgi:uncharacterized protein YndB with AHSA1/START domain
MPDQLIAKSTVTINAPVSEVWKALVTPELIQQYMMGMLPQSAWTKGSELRWKGRHEEKPDDNARGIITNIITEEQLAYTFYYPGYGYPDELAYYNQVVYKLQPAGSDTNLSVEQGDFSVFKEGEVFLGHTQSFWDGAVLKLKELVEANN